MKHEVDMIILSWAKNDELKKVTEDGIQTCIDSDPNIQFNFYIVETNKKIKYDYPNTLTIHPASEFGYHKYMNIGRREGKSKYVCLCNNDLTYEKEWASEIIKVIEAYPQIKSASPWCPQTQGDNTNHIGKIYQGYGVRQQVAGWCIFQQRDIYEQIENLDEGVNFWFSDNIYADQLKLRQIPHVLVPTSVVNHHEHIVGKTGETAIDEATKQNYMHGQHENYQKSLKKLMKMLKR